MSTELRLTVSDPFELAAVLDTSVIALEERDGREYLLVNVTPSVEWQGQRYGFFVLHARDGQTVLDHTREVRSVAGYGATAAVAGLADYVRAWRGGLAIRADIQATRLAVGFSQDEALVLFDWLARTSNAGQPAPFADQAEQRVLWDLQAMLESELTATFSSTYHTQLEQARARLRDAND